MRAAFTSSCRLPTRNLLRRTWAPPIRHIRCSAPSLKTHLSNTSPFSPFQHRALLRDSSHTRLRILCLGSLTAALTLVIAAPVVLAQEPKRDHNASSPGEERTLEERMLEESERERKGRSVPEDLSLIQKVLRNSQLFLVDYIIEPFATGCRFITLLAIFAPVILTIPFVYLGSRLSDKSDERTGTLWWYGFLLRSLERAGPTFIKVYDSELSCFSPSC
jgi:aarF domain-containing kinase